MGEEPTESENELIAVNYGVQAATGKAFVRVQVNGEDKYLLTIRQAREIGMNMIEAAGLATYEQGAFMHISKTGCPNGARKILHAFRDCIKAIKTSWQ